MLAVDLLDLFTNTLVLILALWVFWTLFVLIMGFYRAHLDGRLKGASLVMALPWLAAGLTIDFVANIVIASLLFLDIPRELLVTRRLKRYIAQGTGWRCQFAGWICSNLLDVFDPRGEHC